MYNLFSCLLYSKFTISPFQVNPLKVGCATTDLKSAAILLKYTLLIFSLRGIIIEV